MKTLCFLILFFSNLAHSQTQEIILEQGSSKVFYAQSGDRVWIRERSILSGSNFKNQILLKTKKLGSSEVVIGKRRYIIHVLTSAHNRLYLELKKWSATKPMIKTELRSGQIYVTGKLYSFEHWQQIVSLADKESWILDAEMPDLTRNKILQAIRKKLENENLNYLFIQASGSWRISLSPKDKRLALYKSHLLPLGVQVLEDSSALSSEPLIRIRVTVAEIKREFSRKIGLKWPESLKAQVFPDGSASEYSPLLFTATGLENSGFGRVLASPNLLVKSGEDAEFSAGGEFPIKVLHHRTETIEWKKYGINLKIKPKSDASGRIEINIETQVSNIDFARSVNDVPALTHHNVKSSFSLSRPTTVVLSGLIRNEDSKNLEGLPSLSRIPVLGSLFGSQDFKENRSELMIFVRPEIVHEQFESNNSHLGSNL